MSPLRWTNTSTRPLSRTLTEGGHKVRLRGRERDSSRQHGLTTTGATRRQAGCLLARQAAVARHVVRCRAAARWNACRGQRLRDPARVPDEKAAAPRGPDEDVL